MASASARSRKSLLLPSWRNLSGKRASSPRNLQTEAAAQRSAIAFAKSFASISSRRVLDHRAPLLHRQGDVEIQLILARLRLLTPSCWEETRSMTRLWSDYKVC